MYHMHINIYLTSDRSRNLAKKHVFMILPRKKSINLKKKKYVGFFFLSFWLLLHLSSTVTLIKYKLINFFVIILFQYLIFTIEIKKYIYIRSEIQTGVINSNFKC